MMNDESFLESFEKCTLPWKEWNHIAHVRMAYLRLKKYGELLGTEMIVKGIKQYNKFNSDKKMEIGYHETITRFWIKEIKLNLQNSVNFREFEKQNSDLMKFKYIFDFYDKKILLSDEARLNYQRS